MDALTETKKKENETIEEFNKKFNNLVSRLHRDIKPPDASILIYYIEAFEGEMRYQPRDKEPTSLHGAMETAKNINRNMQASGKSNLPSFSRGNASIPKLHDSKGKAVEPESKDQTKDSFKEITELMKQMMVNHTSQMNAMQNRLITTEKTHIVQNQRSFQPRPNQEWKKKYPPQEQRRPNQRESNNMVDEVPPYCRPCEEFHEEST